MTTISTVTPFSVAAPTRADPTTFSSRGDTIMTEMVALVPDINTTVGEMNAVAGEVNANAAAAATSEANAASSETAAAVTANAARWVAGTYALDANAISPLDGQTYRNYVSAGVRNTDPKNDPTNWAKLGASSTIETVNATITTSTTLTGSYLYVPVQMSSLGQSVTLPDATTLSTGGPQYIIDNTNGGYPAGIRDSAGALLMAVAAGGEAYVSLRDNSTAAGVWSITGTNLEPGLITIDSTFSSTYASTVLAPYAALDDNVSIHFAALASGFAAFVVDNAGKVISTPVTVSATASHAPLQCFKIDATHAMLFYGIAGAANNCAVLTLAGVTPSLSISVGTPAALTNGDLFGEDFVSAPKVAQLSSSLYVLSNCIAAGANPTIARAISVAGTTVTVGSAVNIIASNSVQGSTTTYALTATTALVLYLSGAATPYAINAVVVSVAGTVCTVGSPAAAASTESQAAAIMSCLLSPTKALVTVDNNSADIVTHAITIAGTTVTWGAALTVESGVAGPGIGNLTYVLNSATRYNPHLFPLSANAALLWYLDSSSISRTVVLTEAAEVVTKGAPLYLSVSAAALGSSGYGSILPQGTTEFCSVIELASAANGYKNTVSTSKIVGTTITPGGSVSLDQYLPGSPRDMAVAKIASSGKYVICGQSAVRSSGFPVFSSNGDSINFCGAIKTPIALFGEGAVGITPVMANGNRVVVLAKTNQGTTVAASTYQLRLLNVEIAA